MQIKFIPPDPRAGMTVTMDSSRGEDFVKNGNAVRVTVQVEAVDASLATSPAHPVVAAKLDDESMEDQEEQGGTARDLHALAAGFIEGTVPEVTARIEGADAHLLTAALAAENGSEKPRKGVLDALTAAIGLSEKGES
jgi:hypothetical protein